MFTEVCKELVSLKLICNLVVIVTHIKTDIKYFSKVITFIIQKCLQTPKEQIICYLNVNNHDH